MAESKEIILKRMREKAAKNALEADKLIKGPLAEARDWALANPDPEIEKQAQLAEGPSIMSQERLLKEVGATGMVSAARKAAAQRAFLINASPVGSAEFVYEGGKKIVSGVKEGSPKKVAIGAAQGAAGAGMLGLDMAGLGLLTTGTGPLLRSKLADVVAALKPGEKVSTQRLGATLAKGGVKKVEMYANQLDSLVKAAEKRGQKSISKEEILKHIEDNPVDLGQTQLGGTTPQWERITHPGGTNYQEILVTAPGKHSGSMTTLYDDGTRLTEAGRPFMQSHHRTVPDVMAHIRTKDRVDLKGRKIFFIEEFQSDWHQQGRIRGYSLEENETIRNKLEGHIGKLRDSIEANEAKRLKLGPFGERGKRGMLAEDWMLFDSTLLSPKDAEILRKKLEKTIERYNIAHDGPVPPAPYRETKEWTDLLMKRAMREAAEGSYDGIAFTRGGDVSRISDMPEKSALHYYDRIIPGSAQRVSGGKLEKTSIRIRHFAADPQKGIEEFPVIWLTDAVKGRALLPYDKFAAILAAGAAGGVGAKALQDNKTEEAQ